MATATSTLVLALQARNESQAAFAEIRAAMQEQVTQAREASAQQQTAVKASAEQQLLAVKQGLAQQVLAQRQALEQQIAAIRASGTGNVDAQVLAAKQGYEQQVLAARTAAEDKALAIKTGMAQELDVVRAGLAQQVDAQKIASAEQIAAVRTQATEEVAALRAEAVEGRGAAEGGMLGRVPIVGGLLGGERAAGILDLGKTVVGFAAATAAITAVVEGIHELPRAFAEAATEGESFQAQMSNFTRSWEDAGKVLEWTNQQALKMPFTLAQIREATASLAEAHIDPRTFLPAAGDIAAAYHTQLTDFVGVAERAIATGSTRGLQSYLHMTKAQLAAVGLEWDKHGKLISSSVEPGLERLAQVKFGGAMLREAHTAQGAMQILSNQWEIFKEVAGEGLFAGLKNTLANVVDWLNSHQRAVQQFALAVGQGLGSLLSAAMRVAGWIYTNFGPPIMAAVTMVAAAWQAAQPVIQGAIRAIQTAMGGIGAFLQATVLPAVEGAIGQMTAWWDQHKQDVGKIFDDIQTGITTFWTWLGGAMKNVMTELQGYWTIAWGVMSGAVGVVVDIVSGDWTRAKTDLLTIWKAVEVGVLQIANGLVDQLIHAFQLLAGPIATVLNAVFVPAFEAIVDVGVELFTFLVLKVEQAFSKILTNLRSSFASTAIFFGNALRMIPGQEGLGAALLAAGAITGGGTGLGDKDIARQAQAAGQGAAGAVGGLLGPHPIPTFSFDDKKATASVDAWFAGVEKGIHYGPKGGFAEAGKTWWETWEKWLKTHGLKLPALPKDWGTGGFPDLTGWAGGGASGGAGGTDAIKALQDADSAARKHLEADIARGAPYARLMADREKIFDAMRAEQKAGLVNADDIFIEMNTTFKDIRQHVHEQAAGAVAAAQSIFTADVTLGAPHTRLLADITAVTDAMTREGDPALQIAAARKTMLDQITKAPGGGKDTLGEAQARFQLLMEKGPLTLATGIADINAIAAAERALPPGQRPSDATITLDVLRDTKDLIGKLLTQADEKLKLDIANHADSKKLLQDEAASMKLFALQPGVTPTDIAYQKKQLDDAIASATGGPATRGGPIAPVPRYGALAGETGYGQATVSFGGRQVDRDAQIIAELRQSNRYWQQRAERDERVIALLEGGNQIGSGILTGIRSIDHIIGTPPRPPLPRSANSVLKAAGSFALVNR